MRVYKPSDIDSTASYRVSVYTGNGFSEVRTVAGRYIKYHPANDTYRSFNYVVSGDEHDRDVSLDSRTASKRYVQIIGLAV